MAATKSQGKSFTVFIVGITVAATGLAFIASGIAKLAFAAGLAIVGYSFYEFLKLKPLEGETAVAKQPVVLKLAGLAVALLGWAIVLVGLNMTPSVAGRMITTLLGMAVSLVGVLGILPIAANKNAIWKS